MKDAVIFISILAILNVISFLATAGIIKVLSFCFGFAFSWKLALGIWIILWALNCIIKTSKGD